MIERIRPHPHRGDVIASGAVVLTTALLLTVFRFGDEWGDAPLFAIPFLGALLIYGMGLLAPLEEDSPRAYHSALLVSGLALWLVALQNLAVLLGADYGSGMWTWVLAVLAGLAAYPSRNLNSAICGLIAAVAAGVATLAFVDWVFDPDGIDTFRWILLLLVLVYAVVVIRLRDARWRHQVHVMNAAGLAALVLGLSFLFGELFGLLGFDVGDGDGGLGFGWEVFLLAVSFGLIALGAVDREPGPTYLGAANLFVWILIVNPVEDASLIGWPIVLILIGGAMVGAGLRPRRELPPEPGPPEPAPTVPLPPNDAPTAPPPPNDDADR